MRTCYWDVVYKANRLGDNFIFARNARTEVQSDCGLKYFAQKGSFLPMTNASSCFHLPDAEFEKIVSRFDTNLVTAVINAVCSPLAVAVNALVAFVIFRQAGLRQPSNLLLGYLAVSDFLVGLIVQPNYVLFRLLENHSGYVPCFLMVLYSTSFYICYGVSFTTLSAISYERFAAVKSQVRYNETVNSSRVHKFVLGIWLLNIVLNALQWTGINQIVRGVHLTIWLVCLLAAGFFYCRIRRIVGRHNRSTRRDMNRTSFNSSMRKYKMEVKLTLNIAVIIVIYYIFNLPVLCITMYHQIARVDIQNYNYYSWSETVALLSSSVNPLVCCWKNASVRRSILQLFKDGPVNQLARSDVIALRSRRRVVPQPLPSTLGDHAGAVAEMGEGSPPKQNLATLCPPARLE